MTVRHFSGIVSDRQHGRGLYFNGGLLTELITDDAFDNASCCCRIGSSM